MNDNTSSIISKVWSFCNTLRDDGVGYGDYLEQLTYLLFLKMADEFSKPPYNRKLAHSKGIRLGKPHRKTRRRTGRALHHPAARAVASKRAFWGRYSPRARTRFRTRPSSSSSSI